MTQQLYFVAKGRTVRGPVADRKKTTVNGKVAFTGTPGKVYRSHNADGEPVALPSGFVDYAKGKKETNGQSLLQNLIDTGYVVLTPGASSPVEFAKAMPVDLVSTGGVITPEKKD